MSILLLLVKGFVLFFLCRHLSAQNPPVQQHTALDAKFLGHLDKRISANLQRQALP